MNEKRAVRPSPIAGTWYSANPGQLQKVVDGYLENAELPQLPGEVIAVVAPHAGYRYSGAVAGHAFGTVAGKSFDFIAVLSPLHQYHPQPLFTSAHIAYRTPLGDIPVAEDILSKINVALTEKMGLSLAPIAYDQEHSLEIELPFLQRAVKGEFKLIPIMLRDQTRQMAQNLGKVLADTLKGKSCLLVASSDLSHFYPESSANQLDHRILAALSDFSPDELFHLKQTGEGQACGLAAMAAVLWASRELGGTKVTLLSYNTSAAATGDRSSVVGYGAAAITRPA